MEIFYDTAQNFGFGGIHITYSLYTEFCLNLNNIPDYFHDFKLTFHLGELKKSFLTKDYETFDKELENAFELAIKHNMHDISFHPIIMVDILKMI